MTIQNTKLTVTFEEEERRILGIASDIITILKEEMERQHCSFAIDNWGGQWDIDNEIEDAITFCSRLADCDSLSPLEIE